MGVAVGAPSAPSATTSGRPSATASSGPATTRRRAAEPPMLQPTNRSAQTDAALNASHHVRRR